MGSWNWTWQGTLTSVAAALLLLGVPTLLTWVKKKWPQHGELVRYWLTSAAAMAILLYATTGYILFAKHEVKITPENLELNIRKWSDDLGFSVARLQPGALPQPMEIYFGLAITLSNGNPILVYRAREKSAFLQLVCPLALSPEHLQAMAKLRPDQQEAVNQEIQLELSKTKVGFSVTTSKAAAPQASGSPPIGGGQILLQQMVILSKGVPISGDLNEATFASDLDEMDDAITLTRAQTALALRRYTLESVPALHVEQH